MKQIPLTQGKVALINDEDFERVSAFKWYAGFDGWNWYAVRNNKVAGKRTSKSMHVEIMGVKGVDHINRDGLDNRRANLRQATQSQNEANRRANRNNKAGCKGVCWHKKTRKYRAQIEVNGRKFHLGYFHTVDAARVAYSNASMTHFGSFSSESEVR